MEIEAAPLYIDNVALQRELNNRPAILMQDQRQDPLVELGITIDMENETEQSEESEDEPVSSTPVVDGCDPRLWQFVHRPERLQIIEPCKIVTGIIEEIEDEFDGDIHVQVRLDDPSVINQANITGQKGRLVVEPICQRPAREALARIACEGYDLPITIPSVGTHVKVTGSYVSDNNHDGWAEIHPATSIEVIPQAPGIPK